MKHEQGKMLDGKVVVVTGAESGIGREIAFACAAQGARICAAGIVADGLAETVETISRECEAGRAIAVRTDIGETAQIDEMYRQTLSAFGRLDATVANAAAFLPLKPLLEVTAEEWSRILAINLTGTFMTIAAAGKILIGQGQGGSLMATGSSTVLRSNPGTGAYVAAKGGVHAMMKTLALELAPHRIRVNTLVPGQTATPPLLANREMAERAMKALPMGEFVQPEELGRYAAFALSDAMPHLTGSLLVVDAGRTSA